MSKRPLAFAVLLLTAAVTAVLLLPSRQPSRPPEQKEKVPQAAVLSAKASVPGKQLAFNRLSQLPLSFEENLGQTDARVKYLSRGTDYGLFLTTTEATIVHHAKLPL